MLRERLGIDRTVVINLDRRGDRWEYMQAHLAEHGAGPVARVSATDGRALAPERLAVLTPRARALIQRHRRWHHEEIHELGAVGAALSHLGIWRELARSGGQRWLIFEDDVRIDDGFAPVVARALAGLPAGFDILFLGHHASDEVELAAPALASSMRFWGAHAYVLASRGAAVLSERTLPLWMHLDSLMAHLCRSRELAGYFVVPSVVSQLEERFGSDIIPLAEGGGVTYLPWGRFPDQDVIPEDDGGQP